MWQRAATDSNAHRLSVVRGSSGSLKLIQVLPYGRTVVLLRNADSLIKHQQTGIFLAEHLTHFFYKQTLHWLHLSEQWQSYTSNNEIKTKENGMKQVASLHLTSITNSPKAENIAKAIDVYPTAKKPKSSTLVAHQFQLLNALFKLNQT